MGKRNRGKRKGNIRAVTGHWPTLEEKEAVVEHVTNENQHPIVVAVLGASMLEFELERLLRPKFARKDNADWARLVGENGPLATFSQKITAGYSFGLYDEIVRDALVVAKNVRNAFAHSKKIISFDNEFVISELRRITTGPKKRTTFYKNLALAKSAEEPNKSFVLLCLTISIVLTEKHTKIINKRASYWKKKFELRVAKINPLIQAFLQASGGVLPPTMPVTDSAGPTNLGNLQMPLPALRLTKLPDDKPDK
jgi:hypothetical protein